MEAPWNYLRPAFFAAVMIMSSIEAADAAVSMKERLAEAMAATRICKNVSLNPKVFGKVARSAGLNVEDGSSDMKTLQRDAERKVQRFRKLDVRIICLVGETDFGPQGAIIRNLLRVHKSTPPITQF